MEELLPELVKCPVGRIGRKAASVGNHEAQKEAFNFIVYKTFAVEP